MIWSEIQSFLCDNNFANESAKSKINFTSVVEGEPEIIKVCHVTSVHSRYDTRIFIKECTSLANAGYDVTLLVADNKPDEVRNGVKITSVDFHPKNRFDRILHSVNAMFGKAVEIDAEIYHLHDPELLPLGKKLKQHGKKVIFDSHENYPAQILSKAYLGMFAKPIASVYKICETYLLKNFYDAVIVPCTFEGKNIFDGRCEKVVLITQATKLEEFYDKYETVDKSGYNTVCYVGGLVPARGITQLVKAAYKAGTRLILAGKILQEGYLEELQALPEFVCVDYRGILSREQIFEVYKQSAIGASVLLDIGQYGKIDTLATKIYEYMSMGMPSIVNKYAYADSINKKYHFGITVTPNNVDELAVAIRDILDNPEEARKMGENGRKAIKEEFNWGIEEKKFLKLYEELEM